jgi:hypothetical protein
LCLVNAIVIGDSRPLPIARKGRNGMADPAPHTTGDTSDDTGAGAGRGDTLGMPAWVKVLGIILAVLILLFVVVLLLGDGPLGSHGPGRHASSGDSGGPTPASGTTAVQVAPAPVADGASLEAGLR